MLFVLLKLYLVKKHFLDIIFCPKLINHVCFVDFPVNRAIDNINCYLRYLVLVIFNWRNIIIKMFLDPLSKLSRFTNEQQFLFIIVKHKYTAFIPWYTMYVRF